MARFEKKPDAIIPVGEGGVTDTSMGWGVLIGLVCGSFATLLVLYFMRAGTPGGVPSDFVRVFQHFPHALLMFGIIADIFTLTGAYSYGTFLGLLSIPVNWALGFGWTGLFTIVGGAQLPDWMFGRPPTPTGGHRGGSLEDGDLIEFVKTSSAPQNLVIIATIMFYYLLDIGLNRSAGDMIIALTMALVTFFGTAAVNTYADAPTPLEKTFKTAISLANGLVVGGIGFLVMDSTEEGRKHLPSAVMRGSGYDGYLSRKKD